MLPTSGTSLPDFEFTLHMTSATLALADSLIVAGFEVVRGRVEVTCAESVFQMTRFSADPTLRQRVTVGVQNMHARHCIHPAEVVSPQWQDVLISPYLGSGTAAARLVCEAVAPASGTFCCFQVHGAISNGGAHK